MLRFEVLDEVLLFLSKFCLFLVTVFDYYGATLERERSVLVAETFLELELS